MTLIASLRRCNREFECGSDKIKSRTEIRCKVAQNLCLFEDSKVDELEKKRSVYRVTRGLMPRKGNLG